MSGVEIVLGIVLGLTVNEMCDISPWLARKIVSWSAHQQYVDPERARLRAEELCALINERPGKLFKLATGLTFAVSAMFGRACGSIAHSVSYLAILLVNTKLVTRRLPRVRVTTTLREDRRWWTLNTLDLWLHINMDIKPRDIRSTAAHLSHLASIKRDTARPT